MSEAIKKEIRREELSLDDLENITGGYISFRPLNRYLKEHNISFYDLIKAGILTPTETTRIRADHNFRLSFVDRLCEYLGCKITDVIEFIPNDHLE